MTDRLNVQNTTFAYILIIYFTGIRVKSAAYFTQPTKRKNVCSKLRE